jgi:hypothetical protein
VERVTSMWPAAHFRPFQAVQVGQTLSSCIQFNSALPILGSWCSRWCCPTWPSVEVEGCSKVIYYGKLLWGWACSYHIAPIYLQPSNRRLVLRLINTYMLPLPSHKGPQLKIQHAVKENCHPSETPWGSACSCSCGPCSLLAAYWSQVFSFVPCVCRGSRLLLHVMKGLVLLVS